MESESTSIPEEYVDMLVEEFAYDPVRLPPTEDPAQVLYNRRTLETIWDIKHEAVNPFTRQPFDISNVIPQAELRQEMHRYIVNSTGLTERLEVISDYTKALSEREMETFLKELVSDYQCLVNAEKEKRDLKAECYWKGLWQKFNLLRLYCQYRPENRDVFCSIRGYEYLLQVVDGRFYFLCRHYLSSCDDAKEVLKEVGRIVDVVGLKDSNFSRNFLFWIATILCCVVTECDHLKIHSMVLRIYREMFYDLNIENLVRSRLKLFCFCTVHVTLHLLGRENFRDITNEDLYNGMAILKAIWIKNQITCIESDFDYVGVLVDSVILCISRFHYLHDAAIAAEIEPRMAKKKNTDDEAKNDEEAKNVHLISVALERGLWLINSIVTARSHEEQENEFFSESKEMLQKSDIVREIVRMVEVVLAGSKCLGSSHLQFGLNIVAALLKEEGCERRNDAVRVFGDFLGSDIVDEYDSDVRLLLQEFMQNDNVSEQT